MSAPTTPIATATILAQEAHDGVVVVVGVVGVVAQVEIDSGGVISAATDQIDLAVWILRSWKCARKLFVCALCVCVCVCV